MFDDSGSMWGDSPYSEEDANDYENCWSDDNDSSDDSWFYFGD